MHVFIRFLPHTFSTYKYFNYLIVRQRNQHSHTLTQNEAPNTLTVLMEKSRSKNDDCEKANEKTIIQLKMYILINSSSRNMKKGKSERKKNFAHKNFHNYTYMHAAYQCGDCVYLKSMMSLCVRSTMIKKTGNAKYRKYNENKMYIIQLC